MTATTMTVSAAVTRPKRELCGSFMFHIDVHQVDKEGKCLQQPLAPRAGGHQILPWATSLVTRRYQWSQQMFLDSAAPHARPYVLALPCMECNTDPNNRIKFHLDLHSDLRNIDDLTDIEIHRHNARHQEHHFVLRAHPDRNVSHPRDEHALQTQTLLHRQPIIDSAQFGFAAMGLLQYQGFRHTGPENCGKSTRCVYQVFPVPRVQAEKLSPVAPTLTDPILLLALLLPEHFRRLPHGMLTRRKT